MSNSGLILLNSYLFTLLMGKSPQLQVMDFKNNKAVHLSTCYYMISHLIPPRILGGIFFFK